MQKLRISVALPVYNSENFIVDQVKSIVNQTKVPDEIIICDDKSTDNTVKKINDLIKDSNNLKNKVKLYQNPSRLGMNLNFQEAINKCSGDIIFLSDSDDYWFRNKIKYIVNIFIKDEYLLIINNCRFTNSKLKPYKTTKIGQINKIFGNTDNFIPGCCTAFKKELIKYYLPLPNNNQSYDTWLHFVGNFLKKRKVVNKVFQLYRRHENNNTHALFNKIEKINFFEKYLIRTKILFETIFNRKKIIQKQIDNYEILKKRLIKNKKSMTSVKLNKIDECDQVLNKIYSRQQILNSFFIFRFIQIFLLKKNNNLWANNRNKIIDFISIK